MVSFVVISPLGDCQGLSSFLTHRDPGTCNLGSEMRGGFILSLKRDFRFLNK